MKISHAILASGLWFAANSLGNAFVNRIIPGELWIGPEIGLSRTHLQTTQEVTALLTPTPGADPNPVNLVLGGSLQAIWKGHFSLTLAARKEWVHLNSDEAVVSFPDNPFPHTLSSHTRLSYNVWPLLLGVHLGHPRHSWVLQAGFYTAFLDQQSHQWIVDGEPYANTPEAHFRSQETGFAFATEFSSQWGRGQWKLGVASRRGQESLTDTWRGSFHLESAQILLGYRWNLLGK